MWRTLSDQAREAIGELCDEHGKHLYDYCRTALAGSDAELAVAGALLSAHAHAGRLAEPRLMRPWLYALARAHRAAIAATRPASTGSWSRPGAAPDLVPEGLMALDGPHRELLDLSVRHGLTHAEIAMIFDAEAFEVEALVTEAADTLEEWFAAVRAARTREGCPRLATRVTNWTKAPGRRNRTRIARHILSCTDCRSAPRTVRAGTLLGRLPLATMPSTLREQPAWGRPLPDDDAAWRPDGFPAQARGLVEPPPALISLVPGPTTETREPSWPVAGAAATGQEPSTSVTAPANGNTLLGTATGAPGTAPGGTPPGAGDALPGAALDRRTSDTPRDGSAVGVVDDAPPGAERNRDPAGRAHRGRDPLAAPGTALLHAAHQAGERHAAGPAVPDQRHDRLVATGPARTLPEIPSQRPTPTRQAPGSHSPQVTSDLGRRLLQAPAAEAGSPALGAPRRSAEPGDKLVFAGAYIPRERPVREEVRVRVREPELNAERARVREQHEWEPSPVREETDEQWEEFWEERPDEDDPEARFSLQWLVRAALVIGLVMLFGGLAWSGIQDRSPEAATPAPVPTAQAPTAPEPVPTAEAAVPTAEASDRTPPSPTATPEQVKKTLPAPPAPVARLSPESVQLGTRRTGTFTLSCTGVCQVTSFAGTNGIVISGNSFTVRAPAERPGCSGPPVTESGVITIGWSGAATGDGRSTEGTAAGDGTLTMIVSWTVTSNRGAFIPDTNGGGYWSNCPKSE
ncbi:hypothetical protein [Nonomuraea sp. LPB2021202275-12-8]|uniref:hypothetical protein n=1 Tax=Nonomuraea sp. LPB2021202275-12-8 TaxID=3120159 RepID=UPI00300CB149